MNILKFKDEIKILKKFFEIYCKGNHQNQNTVERTIIYKEEEIPINLLLCNECIKK